MGKLKGLIKLSENSIEMDTLIIDGDEETLKILLALIDPKVLITPNVLNKQAYLKAIKSGVKRIVIALGKSAVPKEVLLESLKFAKVK